MTTADTRVDETLSILREPSGKANLRRQVLTEATGFLLLVVLAVTLQLLLADRGLATSWLRPLAAERLPAAVRSFVMGKGWPGIYPLLALILLTVIADPIYCRLRWLGWLVPPLAVAAALLMVIDIPKALGRADVVPVGGWVQLLAAGFLTVMLAKFALLHRFAVRAYTRVPKRALPLLPLLPSQEENVRELVLLLTESTADRVLPIEGRLGEGKSFLVHWLQRAWEEDRSKPVVVIVDVWQQQTDSDLQGAILESLYSHRAYLQRLNWLQIPASFLIARWIAAVHSLRSSIELRVRDNKAAVELDLNIPRLRWQSHFERVTSHVTRSGRGTVVVLDEIDRATPLVAQAALTLARRSVDVPGVTVVIPYIRSLIRFKAFNPLLSTLPDLGSAMDAILYEERFGALSNGALGNPDDSILSTWTALWSQDGKAPAGLLPGTPYSRDRSLTDALHLAVFANAARPFRDRMQERFEEKYLGVAALQLHPPRPDDLAAMVVTFEGLQRKVRMLTGPPDDWGDINWADIRTAIQDGLTEWRTEHGELLGPPLRVLEGALYRIFQEAVLHVGKRRMLPADIAALAVAAYDIAGLVHSRVRTS